MAETEEQREQFANAVIRFLIYFGFDGLDVDWEYPGQRSGLSEDGENLSKLLMKLREKMVRRQHILSVAVPAIAKILNESYNLRDLCAAVDFVNIMGYDMHNPNRTSAHAPLRKDADEMNVDTVVCFRSFPFIDQSITKFLNFSRKIPSI